MKNENETNQLSVGGEIDRTKLKQERALRNKQKKAVKKLQKQQEREQKEIILRLQPKSGSVTLITRDFAEKVGNSNFSGFIGQTNSVCSADFPYLGARCRANFTRRYSLPHETGVENEANTKIAKNEKKSALKVELADFINSRTSVIPKPQKSATQYLELYCGNPLDSDLPVRRKGKCREDHKAKKASKLKRNILQDKSECEGLSQELDENETCSVEDLTLFADNVITEELDDVTKKFVQAVVTLQEKLYKRDVIKGTSKRRYVVGLHEAKKYLGLNKVKILIIASDIQFIKRNGALSDAIKQIVLLAKTNNTPYLFALKRRILGTLTLKYIPVSCIAVLNYEGLEDPFNNIMKLLPNLKEESKHKMYNIKATSEVDDDVQMTLLNKLMTALK